MEPKDKTECCKGHCHNIKCLDGWHDTKCKLWPSPFPYNPVDENIVKKTAQKCYLICITEDGAESEAARVIKERFNL